METDLKSPVVKVEDRVCPVLLVHCFGKRFICCNGLRWIYYIHLCQEPERDTYSVCVKVKRKESPFGRQTKTKHKLKLDIENELGLLWQDFGFYFALDILCCCF